MATTHQETDRLRLALKEWAVVVRALEEGTQTVVLRKGGIAEKGQRFKPRGEPFLLFPTFEHQDAASLQPAHRALLAETLRYPHRETRIPLTAWATVARAFRVEDVDPLLDLADEYVWSEEEVRDRWAWKPERPLHLLALRVRRLDRPAEADLKPQYGGCRSWVELHDPVDTADSRPVLDDGAFAGRVERISSRLGG